MDIKHMLYFKTIVDQGTISKAARVLHMAQPPLSMALKQLEDELHTTLLKRGSRQIEVSEAGALFYKRCVQILELVELSRNEVILSKQETLKIGITSSNHGIMQNPHLVDFLKKEDIHLSIKEGTTYDLLEALLNHTIDLGIVRTPFDSSLVEAHYLSKEPMVIVGSDKYNCLEDLGYKPVIIHQRYLTLIQDYIDRHHIHLNIKAICDDSRTSIMWARLGIAYAIVPYSCLDYSSLPFQALKHEELYTGKALITRKHEVLNNSIQEFIALCKKEDYLHT